VIAGVPPVRPRAIRAGALVAALALLLTGCRLDLTASAAVSRDGSGTAAVEFLLDEALLDELDAIGVDPTVELEAAAVEAEGWTLERRAVDEGLIVALRHDVADAAGFGDAFRSLGQGLSDADPALLIDVEVGIDDEGASTVAGTVAFRPPATAGASLDGEPIGPDASRLAELTRETVVARLVVTLPGAIEQHDADAQDGRTVSWVVPVGEQRSVAARAAAPTLLDAIDLRWALPALVLVLATVLVLVTSLRRRRRTPAVAGQP
jgi:hypothetical protein